MLSWGYSEQLLAGTFKEADYRQSQTAQRQTHKPGPRYHSAVCWTSRHHARRRSDARSYLARHLQMLQRRKQRTSKSDGDGDAGISISRDSPRSLHILPVLVLPPHPSFFPSWKSGEGGPRAKVLERGMGSGGKRRGRGRSFVSSFLTAPGLALLLLLIYGLCSTRPHLREE